MCVDLNKVFKQVEISEFNALHQYDQKKKEKNLEYLFLTKQKNKLNSYY